MIDAIQAAKAIEIFRGARRLCCICHQNPDGDALGAITGIGQLLEHQYPDKKVELFCRDSAPDMFQYLPFVFRIQNKLEPREGDAYVFVDSAEPKLTEFDEEFPQLFDGKSYPSVCFDHHPANPGYAAVNFIHPDAASACEILVAFADTVGWKLSPDIATSLLTGVHTDTGGLKHSNTTAQVYRTVARLLRAGARHQLIVQHVFRSAKISTLRLWGRVLEKIQTTDDGAAIAAVTEGDFLATGADYSELTGAIDYVNALPGMKFSMVLSQRQGKGKGSLRTLRDDVDVAKMAEKLEGGGHKKAAGFALPGKLTPEVRWKVK